MQKAVQKDSEEYIKGKYKDLEFCTVYGTRFKKIIKDNIVRYIKA